MQKLIQTIIFASMLFIFIGCQQQQSSNDQMEILNPNNYHEQSTDKELSAKLGYVRYTKDELAVEDDQQELRINREQVADIITRTMLQSGNFQEVASLVTDREVVIAYEKNSEMTDSEAADIAEKTARSILPSFYEIYTSANPYHMDEIHSLHLQRTDNEKDYQIIERIIDGIAEENHKQNRR